MLTLEEWNSRLPIPRNMETVRRWVRNGQIWPPPLFDGYRYLVQDDAVKYNGTPGQKKSSNLIERINNGKEAKQGKTRPATKPICPK
ncbi:TPA: excisionase [Morganella morganii]|nr:excisionase [Morganella morganii]